MTDKLLITLGCSWTYGIGVAYEPGMTFEQYRDHALGHPESGKWAWRGVVSSRLGYDNYNLSEGGSSNQRQFRLALEFFSSPEWKKLRSRYKTVQVIWAITSTARSEMFSLENNKPCDFLLSEPTAYSKFLISNCYDHEYEVHCLRNQMLHWNDFFENQGIQNHWFDTFNSHYYHAITPWSHPGLDVNHYNSVAGPDWPSWQQVIDLDLSNTPQHVQDELDQLFLSNTRALERLIRFHPQAVDLAARLAWDLGYRKIDNSHHFSNWTEDTAKISFLKEQGMLNPYSLHPTRLAHQRMADIIIESLELQ